MPSPRLRAKDRRDDLSPQDRLELSLMTEPPRDPAMRERLWHLWQQHGPALIERDGPERWHLAIRHLGLPGAARSMEEHDD